MKHFKYRVVAGTNWHVSDEEWDIKAASEICQWFKDFREAEAYAKKVAKATGLTMELLSYPYGSKRVYIHTVKPFMKGRLIK